MRIDAMGTAALLAAFTPVLHAAEAADYRFAVTPFIGYQLGGSLDADDDDGEALDLDEASSFGIILNAKAAAMRDEDNTEWEFYYGRQSVGIDQAPAGVDPSLEIEISHFLAGGTYIGAGEVLKPFLSAGVGAAHISPDTPGYDSETVFAFSIGGGAQLFPESRVGLRLEGRALGSVIDSDNAIFCASGPSGSSCTFRAKAQMLWQWEVFAGLVGRF